MDSTELFSLINRICRLWKIYDDPERKSLLIDSVQKFNLDVARESVDRLAREINTTPTIEQIVSYIRASNHYERETGLCKKCGNAGWIFVSVEGQGTVTRCECEGRFEHENYDRNVTYDGKPIASDTEKQEALIRGLKKYNPNIMSPKINEYLEAWGLKPIASDVVEEEIF